MTHKEVTNILYNLISDANYVESKIVNNYDYRIYKGANSEDYMVCVLNDGGDGFNSEVFHTINECYNWININ
jgi:hypothetical protein